jgi:hypothetical protein
MTGVGALAGEVLPLLYLHGLSSGDFVPALGQFLGSAAGLSAAVITRLTETWKAEQRALAEREVPWLSVMIRRPHERHRGRAGHRPSADPGALSAGHADEMAAVLADPDLSLCASSQISRRWAGPASPACTAASTSRSRRAPAPPASPRA